MGEFDNLPLGRLLIGLSTFLVLLCYIVICRL